MNLSPNADKFIGSLTNMTEATYATYRHALATFETFGIPIDADTLATFSQKLEHRKYKRGSVALHYSSASRSLYLSVLRRYLQWLDANDQIPAGTLAKADSRLKAGAGRKRTIKQRQLSEDLPSAVTYYDGLSLPEGEKDKPLRLDILRNRAIMHTLWSSACRVSELLTIRRKDVEGSPKHITVMGKGRKERTIYLSGEARQAIAAYLAERDDRSPTLFVLHRRNENSPMSRHSAWHVVTEAAHQMGITGNVSPHMIRHARATQLINEGMPIEGVRLILGHESIATTQRSYVKPNMNLALEQLEEFGLQPDEVK